MSTIILIVGSIFCYFLSFHLPSYFPLFILGAFFLSLLSFLYPKRYFSRNFFLVLTLSCGYFFLSDFHTGYLLFLLYTLLYFVFHFVNDYFLERRIKCFDVSNRTVPVVSLNKTIYKNICDIVPGDIVSVKRGEYCFFDGEVISGNSQIDLRDLVGHSKIVSVSRNDFISAGSINLKEDIMISVTHEYSSTIFSKFCDSVFKIKEEKQGVTLVPFSFFGLLHILVLGLFLLLVVYQFHLHSLQYAFMILLIFLADFSFSLKYILEEALLLLAKRKIFVLSPKKLFDFSDSSNLIVTKTGVLTLGEYSVTDIDSEIDAQDFIIEVAAYLEYFCSNRIGKCIQAYCHGKVHVHPSRISNYHEFPNGISASIDKDTCLIGDFQFVTENGIEVSKSIAVGTNLYVAKNGLFLGTITLSDKISMSVKEEIAYLKRLGISHIVTFSKDNERLTRAVSNTLGIYDCYSALTLKDRDFWLCYLKDTYPGKTAYISDDGKNYPVDIHLTFSTSYMDSDIIITDKNFSKVSFLFFFSKMVSSFHRSWHLFSILFRIFLLFLLLWIRDILVLSGILVVGVLIYFTIFMISLYKCGKGDGHEKD